MKVVPLNSTEFLKKAYTLAESQNQLYYYVLSGQYKNAKQCQQEIARIAVNNYEAYKTLKFIRYKFPSMPLKSFLELKFRVLIFNLIQKFTKDTPEEKKLKQMNKDYINRLSPIEVKEGHIDITVPAL